MPIKQLVFKSPTPFFDSNTVYREDRIPEVITKTSASI